MFRCSFEFLTRGICLRHFCIFVRLHEYYAAIESGAARRRSRGRVPPEPTLVTESRKRHAKLFGALRDLFGELDSMTRVSLWKLISTRNGQHFVVMHFFAGAEMRDSKDARIFCCSWCLSLNSMLLILCSVTDEHQFSPGLHQAERERTDAAGAAEGAGPDVAEAPGAPPASAGQIQGRRAGGAARRAEVNT